MVQGSRGHHHQATALYAQLVAVLRHPCGYEQTRRYGVGAP